MVEDSRVAARDCSITRLDAADPKYVKEFFKSNTTGYYLMYSGGHVVLVVDGVVHEFAGSKRGYGATDVGKWLEPYKTMKLTVREPPSKPALAV